MDLDESLLPSPPAVHEHPPLPIDSDDACGDDARPPLPPLSDESPEEKRSTRVTTQCGFGGACGDNDAPLTMASSGDIPSLPLMTLVSEASSLMNENIYNVDTPPSLLGGSSGTVESNPPLPPHDSIQPNPPLPLDDGDSVPGSVSCVEPSPPLPEPDSNSAVTEESPPLPPDSDPTQPPPPPPPPIHKPSRNVQALDCDTGVGGHNATLGASTSGRRKRDSQEESGPPSKVQRRVRSQDAEESKAVQETTKQTDTIDFTMDDISSMDNFQGDKNTQESGGDDSAAQSREEAAHSSITKLMGNQVYKIIDDVGSDGEDQDLAEDLEMSEGGSSEEEYEVDLEELDGMLEEGMQSNKPKRHRPPPAEGDKPAEEQPPQIKEKVVLKEFGRDPFDVLPEGWVTITHHSGMHVYLHKQTRVCTLSRPYFLGPGSARKHDIPISAIPCLQYSRAMKKQLEQDMKKPHGDADNDTQAAADTTSATSNSDITKGAKTNADSSQSEPTSQSHPSEPANQGAASTSGDQSASTTGQDGRKRAENVEIKTMEENQKVNNLAPMEVREYCQKLFQFETIQVARFRSWKARRKHAMQVKKAGRPELPSDTKLITCPIMPEPDTGGKSVSKKKEFMLNPNGKSDVCILHEYVQHAMRIQPRYIYKETDNSMTPFACTVMIGDVEYGTGYANSKKAAKSEAARISLGVIIPEFDNIRKQQQNKTPVERPFAFSFFDNIKIEDPRVSDLSARAGVPMPYALLTECLKRNYGIMSTTSNQVEMEMKPLKHQKCVYTMRVGKHEVQVVCRNKRDGKQQGAQALLQKLHPNIWNWGSILRLYNLTKSKDKGEEQSVTELQSKSKSNKPNIAILEKLRQEMNKIQHIREEFRRNIQGHIDLGDADVTSTEVSTLSFE